MSSISKYAEKNRAIFLYGVRHIYMAANILIWTLPLIIGWLYGIDISPWSMLSVLTVPSILLARYPWWRRHRYCGENDAGGIDGIDGIETSNSLCGVEVLKPYITRGEDGTLRGRLASLDLGLIVGLLLWKGEYFIQIKWIHSVIWCNALVLYTSV